MTLKVNKSQISAYRPDVDGLRALAVMAVILFHYYPKSFRGGFVGVDIFFVISGFLITRILLSDLRNDRFNIFTFYARRITRIFPALTIALLATLTAGWWLLLGPDFRVLGKHVLAGAGFVSNLVLWSESGYFDTQADSKPLLHLWSLGIEEQFYIFWPLILWMIAKSKRLLPFAIALLILVSFSLNLITLEDHPEAAFYSPLSRFWELLLGASLATEAVSERKVSKKASEIFSIVGLIFIFLGIIHFGKNTPFPGWAALLPTFGAMMLLKPAEGSFVNRKLLSNKVMVGIGLISYPLYLFHWGFIGYHHLLYQSLPPPETRIHYIILTIVASFITYRYVERFFRFKISSRTSVGILVVAMISVGFLGALARSEVLSPKTSIFAHYRPGSSFGPCFFDANVTIDSYKESKCLEKTNTSGKLLAIWGDSHIAGIYNGLKNILNMSEVGIFQFGGGGCKPIRSTPPAKCDDNGINDFVLNKFRELKPTTVLIGANWDSRDSTEKIQEAIEQLKVIPIKNIVLVGPFPIWQKELFRVIADKYKDERTLPPNLRLRSTDFETRKSIDERLARLAERMDIRYFSVLNYFCNDDGCLTHLDGIPIAYDSAHLSDKGSENLAAKLKDLIELD